MSSMKQTVRTHRLLLILGALPLTLAVAALTLLFTGAFSGSSASAQSRSCDAAIPGDDTFCTVLLSLESGNPILIQEAVKYVEDVSTRGLIALDSPDNNGGVGAAGVIGETQAAREASVGAMRNMADALSLAINSPNNNLPQETIATAFQAEQNLRSIANMTDNIAPITAQCGEGQVVSHPDDPDNPDPSSACNDLLPLTDIGAVRDETPFNLQEGSIDRFTTFELFPSYSVPLRATIIPPRWTRDPEELVIETGEALSIGDCTVVLKEIRGLQLRLHFDRWTVVRDGTSGLETKTPIWSLEWQPAEYVKTWEMCNKDGEIVVEVEQHVNIDTPLNFFWRYYSAGKR